jgi:hypothetical protein
MPCDRGMGHTYCGPDYEARSQLADMKLELDKVTGMLCSLLRQLDGRVYLSPDIAQWFHDHNEYDKTQGGRL